MNPQDEQRIREEFELKQKLEAEAESTKVQQGCGFALGWTLIGGLLLSIPLIWLIWTIF